MQCRTCNYSLWNLRTPVCPECGTGFDLRTYKFEPGTVGFACPHCGQLHQGTGEQYLPSLSDTAVCQGCGHTMNVREMAVVPLTDDPMAARATEGLPWENRDRLGSLRGLWETCKLAITNPQRIGRDLLPHGSTGAALVFAMIINAVAGLVNVVTVLALQLVSLSMMSSAGGAQGGGPATSGAVVVAQVGMVVVMALVGTVVGPLVVAFVFGGVAHLVLKMTGPVQRDFWTTARTLCYSQGVVILTAIPLCGYCLNYVIGIWLLVVTILALCESQQVSGLRATAAVLVLPVGVVVLAVTAVILAILLA